MRRIAFLSFDWDYKVVTEYYLGLQEHLKDRRDVQVVIFNAYGYYYASHVHRESHLDIFGAVNLADFDALLIQGNRTWPPNLRQEVVDRARKLGMPVVSINYELEGASSVGTNNYQEEFGLVHKVLTDSGRRRPAFVNGLKTSVEAQDRARGYLDACADLKIMAPRFYQANWQTQAGIATAKKMLRHPHDLPDVVFCCNDDLAVGVQETLQDAGVRVPEDVMVTGFDNRDISAKASPRITTIDRDYRAIAVTAIEALLRQLDGEEVPSKLYSPARHVLAASCGYEAQPDAESAGGLEDVEALERFTETFCSFQFAIVGVDSLYAAFENSEVFSRQLDCENAYLTLNESYLAPGEAGAGDRCRLVACKRTLPGLRPDGRHVYATYDRSRILPDEVPLDKPVYLVSPLKHNDVSLGMVVCEGVPSAVRHGLTAFYFTALAAAIESVRKSERIRELQGA